MASRLARTGREWHHLIDLCAWSGAPVQFEHINAKVVVAQATRSSRGTQGFVAAIVRGIHCCRNDCFRLLLDSAKQGARRWEACGGRSG